MRTSLTDIQQTERYINGEMARADAAVFEARLLTDKQLQTNLGFQQRAYRLLQLFHRKLLRKDIADVRAHIFTSPDYADFRQQVQSLFK